MDKQPQLLLWLAAAALLVVICDARLTEIEEEQFLVAHNEARGEVEVGPLRWSKNLATYASRLLGHSSVAASCELSRKAASSKYGVNQAVANLFDSPATVVGSWVDEGRRYVNLGLNNISCAAVHQIECDRYMQVVSRSAIQLGCGKGNCGKDGSHIICLYFPPGIVSPGRVD